ncbi:MAG: hypothetical protein FWD61_19810 [Phycisphaerales bacterium]|nr:hypothetical protein [Phycisphaerales bacterium]
MTVSAGSHFTIGDLRTEQGCRRAFDRLLEMDDEELGQLDVGLVNLLCAVDLPSTDPLDIPQCLAQLDEWAEYARQETIKGFPRYLANPNPDKGSENVYRLWALMHAIRIKSGIEAKFMGETDCEVVNYEMIDTSMKPTGGPYKNRVNSQVSFIHGLLSPRCLGCCASNPVLFAAIGRRLGYPVKIILTIQHVYNRWVDANEQFNMDGSMKYIGGDEDHHYIDRWRPWRPMERAALNKSVHVPLTPRQELATFLFGRSICLSANLRFEEAREACEIARRMFPDLPAHSDELETIKTFFTTRENQKRLGWLNPPSIPTPSSPPPSAPPRQSSVVQASRPLAITPQPPTIPSFMSVFTWGNPSIQYVYKKES